MRPARVTKGNLHFLRFHQNLSARLAEQNQGKVKTTMAFRPWEVVHREEYPSREDAIRRERYLKTGAGRRYLARVLGRLHEE